MKLPRDLRQFAERLDATTRKSLERDYGRRVRSTTTAYILWLCLGWHYLYLGRTGMQFAFWFTFGFFIIGWIIDFFRVPGLVARRNEDIGRSLLSEYSAIAASLRGA